jgi:phosphate transport system protein
VSPGRAQFAQDLSELEDLVLGTLELVLALLDRVIEALEHQDVELSPMVLADDALIDFNCAEAQHRALSLLALQGPVAGDLRLLAALLHVVRYIERMGNQCVSVAKLIPLSGHEPPVRAEILQRVLTMGRCARAEVVQCRRAFAERNVELAEDLVNRDREVNRLNREIFRLAIEAGDEEDTREWAMLMTLVARAFERVGDNAVDVGEQTAFLVTGLFREFTNRPHVASSEL